MLIKLICGLCNPSCVYCHTETPALEFHAQPILKNLQNKLSERPICCAADTSDSVSLKIGGAQ